METAREHEAACIHLRRLDPGQYSVTGVFSQFELNWSLRLTLDHGNTFPYSVLLYEVAHIKFDQITTAKFAVDRDVEQGQVSQIVDELEACADRPDLFRQQWSILTDDPTFVPGSAFRGCCRKLDSWHDLPSDPPSVPCHQHCADSENIEYREWQLPLQLNTPIHVAGAEVFLLRAHAVQKANSQVGLTADLGGGAASDSQAGLESMRMALSYPWLAPKDATVAARIAAIRCICED